MISFFIGAAGGSNPSFVVIHLFFLVGIHLFFLGIDQIELVVFVVIDLVLILFLAKIVIDYSRKVRTPLKKWTKVTYHYQIITNRCSLRHFHPKQASTSSIGTISLVIYITFWTSNYCSICRISCIAYLSSCMLLPGPSLLPRKHLR